MSQSLEEIRFHGQFWQFSFQIPAFFFSPVLPCVCRPSYYFQKRAHCLHEGFKRNHRWVKVFLLLLLLLFLLLCFWSFQLVSINTSSPCFRKSPLSESLLIPALSEFSFQSKAMSSVKHLKFLACHISEFRVPVCSASLLWRQSWHLIQLFSYSSNDSYPTCLTGMYSAHHPRNYGIVLLAWNVKKAPVQIFILKDTLRILLEFAERVFSGGVN